MTELATDSDADDSRSARLGVELLATLAMLSLVMVSGVPLDSAAPARRAELDAEACITVDPAIVNLGPRCGEGWAFSSLPSTLCLTGR